MELLLPFLRISSFANGIRTPNLLLVNAQTNWTTAAAKYCVHVTIPTGDCGIDFCPPPPSNVISCDPTVTYFSCRISNPDVWLVHYIKQILEINVQREVVYLISYSFMNLIQPFYTVENCPQNDFGRVYPRGVGFFRDGLANLSVLYVT